MSYFNCESFYSLKRLGDVKEYWTLEDGKYTLEVNLLKVKKSDLKVSIINDVLNIKVNSYHRTIGLPEDLDVKSIKSKLDLGVLTVTAKKKKDKIIDVEVN